MKKKLIIGYTTGVFDLFHIGHVKILQKAKSLCDKLIVGVSTDSLVKKYKNKKPIIPFSERVEVIRNSRCVDLVVSQNSLDKFKNWKKLKYDVMFVGDDWYATKKWRDLDKEFREHGVKIIYLPYTKKTSSTKINKILDNFRKK
jgi:glycerol-3-phosphate cytidylyltransferase